MRAEAAAISSSGVPGADRAASSGFIVSSVFMAAMR